MRTMAASPSWNSCMTPFVTIGGGGAHAVGAPADLCTMRRFDVLVRGRIFGAPMASMLGPSSGDHGIGVLRSARIPWTWNPPLSNVVVVIVSLLSAVCDCLALPALFVRLCERILLLHVPHHGTVRHQHQGQRLGDVGEARRRRGPERFAEGPVQPRCGRRGSEYKEREE